MAITGGELKKEDQARLELKKVLDGLKNQNEPDHDNPPKRRNKQASSKLIKKQETKGE